MSHSPMVIILKQLLTNKLMNLLVYFANEFHKLHNIHFKTRSSILPHIVKQQLKKTLHVSADL